MDGDSTTNAIRVYSAGDQAATSLDAKSATIPYSPKKPVLKPGQTIRDRRGDRSGT